MKKSIGAILVCFLLTGMMLGCIDRTVRGWAYNNKTYDIVLGQLPLGGWLIEGSGEYTRGLFWGHGSFKVVGSATSDVLVHYYENGQFKTYRKDLEKAVILNAPGPPKIKFWIKYPVNKNGERLTDFGRLPVAWWKEPGPIVEPVNGVIIYLDMEEILANVTKEVVWE